MFTCYFIFETFANFKTKTGTNSYFFNLKKSVILVNFGAIMQLKALGMPCFNVKWFCHCFLLFNYGFCSTISSLIIFDN